MQQSWTVFFFFCFPFSHQICFPSMPCHAMPCCDDNSVTGWGFLIMGMIGFVVKLLHEFLEWVFNFFSRGIAIAIAIATAIAITIAIARQKKKIAIARRKSSKSSD